MEAAERHEVFMEAAMAEVRVVPRPTGANCCVASLRMQSRTCIKYSPIAVQARQALAEQEVPIGCASSPAGTPVSAF